MAVKKFITIALLAVAAFAAEGYKIVRKIPIGGEGRWDYLTLDTANRRLYVSHGASVEVVDPDAGKVVGSIGELHGVHGIAIAADLGKGFISNGQSSSVTIFDLKTLARSGEAATGRNPDAICYEQVSRRVFTFNHTGGDATVIDASTGKVLKSFPLGPAPEFCVADGAGHLYANIEGSSEVVEIDATKGEVQRRTSILPCEGPSGLAIDVKFDRLFSVCDKVMAITDISTMKVIATVPIGNGPDGAGYDPDTGLAFASCGDGKLAVVKLTGGEYQTVETVTTERGARTMTVDPRTHQVYLLAAEYGPAPPPKEGQRPPRPPVIPGTLHVLVVGSHPGSDSAGH